MAEKYKPDIIQLPFNAFDKKAAELGTLKRLKDEGIEVHARSIFLQGLLLMNIKDINKYYSMDVGNKKGGTNIALPID